MSLNVEVHWHVCSDCGLLWGVPSEVKHNFKCPGCSDRWWRRQLDSEERRRDEARALLRAARAKITRLERAAKGD